MATTIEDLRILTLSILRLKRIDRTTEKDVLNHVGLD
jgi:hypothetical protein